MKKALLMIGMLAAVSPFGANAQDDAGGLMSYQAMKPEIALTLA